MVLSDDGRDSASLLLLVATLLVSRHTFLMRGVTYRPTVVPYNVERGWKLLFYLGFMGTVDALLRRGGRHVGWLSGLSGFVSTFGALCLRVVCFHLPFGCWAVTGPLSTAGHTRDDHGWSPSATHAWIWKFLAKYVFKGQTFACLSEEWCDVPAAERKKWQERQYVISMHPHGLLPVGAILTGLTWAGGGCGNITASGAVLDEPENPGHLLHQRWFTKMRLRAAVASGACGLFPGVYEMFTKLGAFECTKPFIQEVLRNGRDVAIFPGGAAESCYATPGRYVAFVKQRKGFVRLALEERRDVLPIWTFGDESLLPLMQDVPAAFGAIVQFMKEATGLAVPFIPTGLPRRPALTTVLGVPVSLEDLWADTVGGHVTDVAVDTAHTRYMDAQQELFDRNKGLVAGNHAKAVLEFI